MIVPDINLLLYAHIDAYAEHARAREWWEALLNEEHAVGIAGPVLFGFVRISTNRRVFDEPLTVEQALGCVEGWIARPHVQTLVPGPRHIELAFGLLRAAGVAGNLTTDAQIAALALEHGAEVHTADGDFGRFPSVRWRTPIPDVGIAAMRPRRRR